MTRLVSTLPDTAYSRDTDPMTQVSRPTKTGWWRLLLAAIAAALVGLLSAGTASAATLPEVETRVGASTPVAVHVIGVHESISAGQRWDKAPPQTQTTAGSCVAANSGMAGVRATGAAGEAAAGIVKNTTRIPSASGKAAYRIPDELNSSVLGEVKNVSHLNYTSQLRDFAAYAKQEGLTFTLYTRGSTTFSSTLRTEIDAGRIVLDTTRLGP